MLVVKRNGELESFDESKIAKAMRGTFKDIGQDIDELKLYQFAIELKMPTKRQD